MSQFRLVILDYAMTHLETEATKKSLNDLVVMKQRNFQRTDPFYVVTDKHDMIGSHFLIYDTTPLYNPKLIFALRVTYEDRSIKHRVNTPFQDLVPKLILPQQQAYEAFHSAHPNLVDCNSWCVDPDFSQKKSGLKLSDIGYAMIYLHLSRMGHNHFIGCTNEKYKASRWLENVGTFPKGHEFVHPVVPDTHMITMVENFNQPFFKSVYLQNQALFDELFEIVPTNPGYKSIPETIQSLFKDASIPKAG